MTDTGRHRSTNPKSKRPVRSWEGKGRREEEDGRGRDTGLIVDNAASDILLSMLSNRNYSFRRLPFDSLGKPHHIAIQPLLRQQTRNPFVCHSRRCLPKSLNPVPDWILDRTTPRVSVNQVERPRLEEEGRSDRKGRAKDTAIRVSIGRFPVLCRRFCSRSSRTFRVHFVAVDARTRTYACARMTVDTTRERQRVRPPCRISLRGPSAVCRNDQAVKARPVSGCRIKLSTERWKVAC